MADENRIHPRVKVGVSAELKISASQVLGVVLENVSQNGVLIETTQSGFETILENNKSLQLNKPVEVDLKFALPCDTAAEAPVSSRCRAIYVRRQSQDKYHIGFKFIKIPQRSMNVVNSYIHTNLKTSVSTATSTC